MDGAGRDEDRARLRGSARLDELIGLVLALEERDGLAERDRRRLDRQIGAASSHLSGLERLRHWLAEAPSEPLRMRLQRLRTGLAGLQALLVAIGFFLGWAAAAALLSIEVHAGRINIVLAWGLLAFAPFLTWVLSLAAWGATRFSRSGGEVLSLGEFVRRLSIGRLAMRALPRSVRDDVEIVMGRLTTHGRLYGRVERSQLLRWSHSSGLAFAVGALASTLAFVVFTDLAFGWSTTLDATAGRVHQAARVIALPWAAIWPDASPSLELVESTRYFRVSSEDHIHVVDPIIYGGWWPFLVMSILAYAIVPRLLGLWAINWVQNRENGRAIGLTAGVDRLMNRLATPLVEGQALEEEGEVGRLSTNGVAEVDAKTWFREQGTGSAHVVAIRWAETLDDDALPAALGAEGIRILDAGGRRSLDEDAEAIEVAVRERASLVFCVRGYEPPVLDVLDFLAAWRKRAGQIPSLCVALVGGTETDVGTWRRKLISLGDSRVVVAHLEQPDV